MNLKQIKKDKILNFNNRMNDRNQNINTSRPEYRGTIDNIARCPCPG